MSSCTRAAALAGLAFCGFSACRAPLTEDAWTVNERGTVGVIGRAGIWADFEAEGSFDFDANFGDDGFDLTADLDGKYGGVIGLEVFVFDDVSLLFGYDRRVFEPEETEGLLFDDITSEEIFLAARWILPWRWLSEGRLRTFVEAKVGYLPSTEFDMEFDVMLPGFENPEFEFDGGDYWNVGLAAGVLYQLRDDLVFQFSLLYEVPLSATEDVVEVDFLGFPISLDSEIEPEGLIVLTGLTWYF
ncbi:MAG: hypothetical protein GY711_14095 [bacterium]|nr:hypothetical protein [bacterium]